MRPILIVLIAASLFYPVIDYQFIPFDDPAYVYENPHVLRGLDFQSILWAFNSNVVGNWHPITMITHLLDVEIYGTSNPGGHHLTNVLIHITNALLLYGLISFTAKNRNLALFVALLFAIHPTRIESVAWVAERKDVLYAFFLLLSLYSYAIWCQDNHKRFYIYSFLMLALSLMSKPMSVTAPFLMLLLDYWPLKRIEGLDRKKVISLFIEKIPHFILVFIFSFVTMKTQTKGINLVTPLDVKLSNVVVSYIRYIGMFLYPIDLSILYPYRSWSLLYSIPGFVFLAVVSVFSIKWIKKYPWLFVGWFFFLGTLVPVIGIVQVGVHSIADRYTYFSYVGLSIIVFFALSEFNKKYNPRKFLIVLLVAVFVINISWQSFSYIRYWKNGFILFTNTLSLHDHGYLDAILNDNNQERVVYRALGVPYKVVGGKYISAGMHDKGIEVLNMALNVGGGSDYQIHKFLAVAYLSKGELSKSECHINQAIELYNEKHEQLTELYHDETNLLEELKFEVIDAKMTTND